MKLKYRRDNLDNLPLIPHLIEEVHDFKTFIKPFIHKGGDRLVGHTKAQQFRFYMRDDRWSSGYALQGFVHFSKLGSRERYTCMVSTQKWQMYVIQ